MTNSPYSRDPVVALDDRLPQDTRGVLGSRLFAWIGDVVVLFVLTWIVLAMLGILGIVTFGLTWLLMGGAAVFVLLGYSALTIGGRKQATFGMRMAGLRVETVSGGRPDALAAAVHALFFYVAAGTVALWLIDILCGLVRDDRRLGHDILTGLVVVRA
ncbi:RDD family protein [Bosea sp. TWI1241]|jgi:uncharacterized RDD family membrane protein YckC|uniref:RDD family protein n=1 Tax=Bosea sp. TWI1241 TaxID=3148904 RepID=UPI00320A898F